MEPKDQIMARMYAVLTLLSIAPLFIVAQTLRIHTTERAELRAQGERQARAYVAIPAIRGAILDRAGRTLAVNTARYDLAVDPTVSGFSEASGAFFDRLSNLIGVPATTLRDRVERRSSPQYVVLHRGVSERQKEEIETWRVPGLILDPTFVRRYNYGQTASHVLGYVSPDGRGLAGLEFQNDEHLRGTDGRRMVRRDRLREIKAHVQGQVVEPVHGESLILTIDLIRQTILEEELARGVAAARAIWGTAIAMDPYTGAIIAMASVPTYDPNRPGAYAPEALRNRAITDRIEPGSTFKLVTAVAAVERNAVAMEDSIETGDGWAVLQGRTLRDTRAHGTISFREVIAQSSNVGTARVAMRLDPGVLYQYARNLGFGQPTWIDLPGEVDGLLKRPAEWSGTTLTALSIGYEVDVTAIQLVTAYAALANGGLLVQPHVVAERRDVTGRTTWTVPRDSVRRVFDPATARSLIPAFEYVVEGGTATRAKIAGLPVAGKTGTARKVTGGSYAAGDYRASFVGFFPADDPKVVMVVILDEPRTAHFGGTVAAPIFQHTAARWIPTYPDVAQRIAPPEELPKEPQYTVPDVRGLPPVIAEQRLRASGYRVRAHTGDRYARLVSDQQPEWGAIVGPAATVRLRYTESASESPASMPDLRGLSARNALFWLHSMGVSASVEGDGVVVSQSPSPGQTITGPVLIRCR